MNKDEKIKELIDILLKLKPSFKKNIGKNRVAEALKSGIKLATNQQLCMNIIHDNNGISIEHMPSGIDTMTILVHQDEFEEKEQQVIAGIHRAVQPDFVEMESDLALIAVVGRGMKSQRGTAGRVFSALAHAHVNVKMIDQGSSELNIIIGVENRDFETAVKAIYDIFVLTQM